MALLPVHSPLLTSLTTNERGETWLFIPAIGYLILIMGIGVFAVNHWRVVREAGWGDRRVAGCLLLIATAIALSGVVYAGQGRVAPLGMGLVLLGCYLAGRILGRDVFLPLAAGAVGMALQTIVYQVLTPVGPGGGWVFGTNYDILAGYVLLGIALYPWRYQWVLAGLGAVTMLLSGSPEGLFAGVVVTVVVLARRDWGRRLAWVAVPLVLVLAVWLLSGRMGDTWWVTARTVMLGQQHSIVETQRITGNQDVTAWQQSAVGYRVEVAKKAMRDISPLGNGYNVTAFREGIVHNVPLILVQQLGIPGILAGVSWLLVGVWCLVKTRRKYAWALIFALSVFDHYIWTQLAPLWWLLVGVSTVDSSGSDMVFRAAWPETARGDFTGTEPCVASPHSVMTLPMVSDE